MNTYWSRTETNSPKVLSKPKVLAKLENHLVDGEEVLVLIASLGSGYLVATKDRCLIAKVTAGQSLLAGSFGGGRVASFYYQDINGIEYNSGLATGVLEIRTASYQGTDNKDFWQGTFGSRNANSNDPFTLSNTLPMNRSDYREAKPLVEKIQKLISEAKTGRISPQGRDGDLASSLVKLSEMLEAGHLTKEEFALAKGKLLGAP